MKDFWKKDIVGGEDAQAQQVCEIEGRRGGGAEVKGVSGNLRR